MVLNSNNINAIDMSIVPFTPDKKKYLFLAKKDKVDFVYNTAALEGNAMTYPEVETLLDGITVGGHKLSDEQQILNQNRSVELLFTMLDNDTFSLSKDVLFQLHTEVAKDEALTWGLFRDGNVNIGGTDYLPPDASRLNGLFEEGVLALNEIAHPILRGLTYFLFGARSQLFYDGNKRTSRLMMNGVLLSNGYPMLNIKAKDRLEFNKQMITFYDSGDYVRTLQYLLTYYNAKNSHLK